MQPVLRPSCLALLSESVEHIAKITFGIDGIIAKAQLQLFTQLANMAFHDGFFDIFVQQPINRIIDLSAAHATIPVLDEIFQNATLTTRKLERFTANLWGTPVEIDTDIAFFMLHFSFYSCSTADHSSSDEDFFYMDRFANHIIKTGCKQIQGLFQRGFVIQCDEGFCGNGIE